MDDPAEFYRANAQTQDTGQLGQLSVLCQEMMVQRGEVEKIEQQLTDAKKKLQELQAGRIPALMAELKLESLTLASGVKIVISRHVGCKFDPATKFEALQWLDAQGHGSMIKHEVFVNFGRGEGELANKAAEALVNLGLKPSQVKDVHHATLAAWAKREVEAGHEVPANLFNLSIFDLAKVKV